MIVPWLRRFVADFPLRRPGSDHRPVHVMDEVALGHVLLRVLCTLLASLHRCWRGLLNFRSAIIGVLAVDVVAE